MSTEKSSISSWIWEKFKTTWPLFAAATFTTVFGIWVYGLASELVQTSSSESATRWEQFRSGEPNAMGDTLAGFIGSLTLIWVVASVIQQSMELRAQRREFAEMVVAQTAQVNALNKQAEIFEDEKKQRDWDGIARVLDELLVNLARKCELLNESLSWEFYRDEDDCAGLADDDILSTSGPQKETAKPFSIVAQSNLDERVHQHAKSLMIFYIAMLHGDRHLRCCKRVNRQYFLGLPGLIDQISDQAKVASAGQQVRIVSLNLDSMKDHLTELQKLDLWLPEPESGVTP